MNHEVVEVERPALIALAYRMLGTMTEAEDAVQETYLRWYRLDSTDRRGIDNPAAWLTRVAGRICLDELASARRRRERYVGPWLPEPLPAGTPAVGRTTDDSAANPAERVTFDESVSTALLVILESLTPAQRLAFVLHDIFAVPFDEVARVVDRSPAAVRQLAATARRRVRTGGRAVSRVEHDALVREFAAACNSGDLRALGSLLDPSATLLSDGGGNVSAARKPIVGSDHVAHFLLRVKAIREGTWTLRESMSGLCVVAEQHAHTVGVMSLGVTKGRVSEIWTVVNPEKLRRWNSSV